MNLLLDKEPVPLQEIERITELHLGIKRSARKMLKDAMEIGDFFIASNKLISSRTGSHRSDWGRWIDEKFPNIHISTIYRYMALAKNRELLGVLSPGREEPLGIREAEELIRSKKRQAKPRVRKIAVSEEAAPLVRLEAKLKNYVVNLWQLRYLQVEIQELIRLSELSPEQVQRVLSWVCKEHAEVQEEVMLTFSPFPRIGQKSA